MLDHALVLAHAPVGMFVADAAGQCIYVNRRLSETAGLAADQMLGSGWTSALHPDDRERVTTEWSAAVSGGGDFRLECRFLRADGAEVWAQVEAVRAGTTYVGTVVDLTERRRAEASWTQLFHTLPEMLLIMQGPRILFANEHATRLLGYSAAELEGMDILHTLSAEDPEVIAARIEIARASELPLPWRKGRLRRKDGGIVLVEVTAVPVSHLYPGAAIVMFRDLSEQNRQAARVRAGVEGMLDPFAILDAVRDAQGTIVDFRIAEANSLLEGIWARRRSHLVGALLSAVSPDLVAHCARATELGAPLSLELERSGQILQTQILSIPDGVAVIFRDVTGARAQQHMLELRGVVMSNMAEGVLVVRAEDDQIVYANAAGCRMFGWNPGELDGRSAVVLNPADMTSAERQQVQAVRRGECSHYELRGRRKNGTSVFVRATMSVIDLPGHGRLRVSVARDIGEEREAQIELARLASLVESSADAIIAVDSDDRIVTWNYAAERLLARPERGSRVGQVIPAEFAPGLGHAIARARTGRSPCVLEGIWPRPGGAPLAVSLQISPIVDGRRAVVGVSLIARDVTASKEAERAVRESLAQKDVLLREIHHRVKNNLQVVSSLFSLQSRRVSDRNAGAALRESQARVRSIALLHERLYRTGDVTRVVMSDYARRLAAEVLRACGSPEGVRARVEPAEVALTLDDAVPCGLILNELITNSVKHAFPLGRAGTLTVAFEQDQDWVVLRVADDGAGLPRGAPPLDTATLGMHLIHTLAGQLDGTATFRSAGGTVCEVRFPSKEARQ